MSPQLKAIGLVIGATVWVGAVIYGFAVLAVYSNTPGVLGSPPSLADAGLPEPDLPSGSRAARYQLIMAVHPRCPCTRASLSELERLVTKCGDDLACRILVYRPRQAPADWHETDTFAKASRMPRSEILFDEDGRFAERLSLKTSGAAVVYSEGGEVAFSGGITVARGHEGDNLGADAVLALVRTGVATNKQCSVFGCSLERGAASRPAELGIAEE